MCEVRPLKDCFGMPDGRGCCADPVADRPVTAALSGLQPCWLGGVLRPGDSVTRSMSVS